MEPPTSLPRRATTLTRLWRSTDAADSIAQFLPTEALPVLPNIAKTFERDHWRLLGALMRRAKRGTAAACKSAVLSTLQMTGRDTVHLREDWADKARFSENWTIFFYRHNGGRPEGVDYTATISPGTLLLDRRTPRNSTSVASQFEISRASDRCCVHRFRVALTYAPNNEGINGCGGGFQFANVKENRAQAFKGLFIIYVYFLNSSFQLRWKSGDTDYILKTVPTLRTFLVDATLDWRTATARVTVDGAELERPVPFRPLPVTTVSLRGGEHPGQHTFGPVDIWYSNTPPPQPPSSVRFEGDP